MPTSVVTLLIEHNVPRSLSEIRFALAFVNVLITTHDDKPLISIGGEAELNDYEALSSAADEAEHGDLLLLLFTFSKKNGSSF